ncbi:MAG TPA: hypothetical protein P5567_04770 [Kiritimatiellia bacterium]|nr:hypothetical protein [Kiritimatiellia bacterium]HSA17441.1 hypothetical protein [Kiritimatiellia bacterium]
MVRLDKRTAWRWLAITSLVILYGPSLLESIRLAGDPYRFNDDARHWLVPFVREAQPGIREDDYLVNYRLAMTPVGHRLFYRCAGRLFDPAFTSKVLPLVQYALLMAALGWCAFRLGGPIGAWATLALALSSREFLYRMAGGTARSWAFPLVAWGAFALVADRPRLLAVLTILAASLYPPIALVLGLALAGLVVLSPGPKWKKAALLLVVFAVSALCMLPNQTSDYGRRLGPADVAAYPELGPGGRYGFEDRPPFLDVASALADAFGRSLQGGDPAWWPALRDRMAARSTYGHPSLLLVALAGCFGLLTLAGTVLLARRETAAGRLLLLLAAAVLTYLAAARLAPSLYFPQRYMIYSAPVLAMLLLPAAVRQLAFAIRPVAAGPATAVVTLACLLLLGGRGGGATGLSVDASADRELYRRLAALPPGSLIAGWPEGALDNVPWLSRRSVLMNRECHEAIHQGCADQMRRRMKALTDAYFATTPEPLLRLRRNWGVTHLLADLAHYEEEAPTYFEPFGDSIREAHAAMRRSGSEVLRQADVCAVFRHGSMMLLDLSRLQHD